MLLTVLYATLVAVVNRAFAQDPCTSVFKRYCASHSYCLPKNFSCINIGNYLTQDDRNQIVDLHNDRRNTIAFGTRGLPPASNMMQMEWDDELAAVAQKYAEQCVYKHDLPNCRQVANFNVGQNLAQQTWSGSSVPPTADWKFAVDIWYDEIKYIGKDKISSFQPPNGDEYRHFSQVAWSNTFRVGCGYVLYKTGNSDTDFTLLYVCNYGPSGNVYNVPVYEEGPPCSKCPINSCCGVFCPFGKSYLGLCQRIDSNPLSYFSPPNLFLCNFGNEPDCINAVSETPNWNTLNTLDGNRLTTVLNGGERSKISFLKPIVPTQSEFCVSLKYRKGPDADGEEEANTAVMVLTVPSTNNEHRQPLDSYSGAQRHQFSTYNLTLSWGDPTQLALLFSVPPGKSAQFFDVDSIMVTNGKCQNSF